MSTGGDVEDRPRGDVRPGTDGGTGAARGTGTAGDHAAGFAPEVRRDRAGAVDDGDDEGAVPAAPPSWWRRNRGLVAVAVLVVLGVVLAVLTAPRGEGRPLAPDNAAPEGARALAQVLTRQGVEVVEADRLDDVLSTASAGTTLLVLDAGVLPPDRLADLRGTGADLVLVQPSLPVLQVLAPELALGGTTQTTTTAPGCADEDARAAGEARSGGSTYVAGDGSAVPGVESEEPSPTAEVQVCYPTVSGPAPDAGSYAVVVDEAQDRRVTVHGQPDVLTNEWLAEEGNAALAVRSLGRTDQLLWYRADPFDPALARDVDDPPTAVDLLPTWVGWLAVQLFVVFLVAVLWRSRRLGRLVPERLPAVVRSAETTEGRARLYRAAGARGAAARSLRR
ncbi:DUF4350 domain-containing protein, partial [Aquipuribacter hungaricus]